MGLTPEQIRARVEVLRSERSNLNGDWETIGRLVAPGRGRMYETHDEETSIRREFAEKYDSTAVVASQSLASALHSGLTSPAAQWFGLRFKQQKLNDDTQASAWLQACEEKIFYSLQESNFNLEVNEMYLDLTSFGTSPIFHEYDATNVSFGFKAAFPREVYFEEDFDGKLIGIYRMRQYTAQQLALKFPTKCPTDIVEQANSAGSANVKYTVIQAVMYESANAMEDTTTILPPEKRPFQEKFILEKDATDLTEEASSYYEMPAYVVRWGRMTGSKYGFSPALNALPDIKTLNRLVSQILDAAAKVIDPPILTTHRGVIGDIDLTPGGETVVRDPDAMRPFESGARFDVSQLQKGDLVSSIRRAFYVEQLELPMSDRMTATEVQVRYEQMQRLLGPALFRLQSDFLDPLIRRSFNILYREQQLPEMPAIIQQSMGEFEVEYMGPLARSQKMAGVDAFQQFLMILANVAPINPDVVNTIKWDDAMRDIALRMGVPAKLLKSDEELEAEAQARAEQEQAMMQMQAAQAQASAMKDGAAAAEHQAKAEQIAGAAMGGMM